MLIFTIIALSFAVLSLNLSFLKYFIVWCHNKLKIVAKNGTNCEYSYTCYLSLNDYILFSILKIYCLNSYELQDFNI